MSETKQPVDLVIAHGLIVTMDDKMSLWRDGALAIRDQTSSRSVSRPKFNRSFKRQPCLMQPGSLSCPD
ncbi:MAG: hypothetical protein IT331_13035 [Anaerolineae bacterium]|nr:hypothetical protein [Anaerolineae bacterium]